MKDYWTEIYFEFAGLLIIVVCVTMIVRVLAQIIERPLIRTPVLL